MPLLARVSVVAIVLALLASGTAGGAAAQELKAPTVAEETAAQAWIYAYPMLFNYKSLYEQTQDAQHPNYIGGFNRFRHYHRVFTPKDTTVVTPNNDTPYSWAWLDLRAEPVVLAVSQIPDDLYYVVQGVDLFTHNFAYVGSRATGNKDGRYLFAGPDWKGEAPAGIDKVFRSESQFVLLLARVQLKSPAHMPNVRAVQEELRLYRVSEAEGRPAPAAPPIDWPKWDAAKATSFQFVGYLNFLLQFTKADPSETELLARFKTIGIGPGLPFDADALSPERAAALKQGAALGNDRLTTKEKATRTSLHLFGSRAEMKNDYLTRAAAAAMGLYGNSAAEAVYTGSQLDERGQPLNGEKHRYLLRFAPGELPPAKFFWSATMYSLPQPSLVANPIERYSLGSATEGLQPAEDGSLTILIQADAPAVEAQANWLPAPKGPFTVVLRMYGPSEAAQSGKWKMPAVERIIENRGPAAAGAFPTPSVAHFTRYEEDAQRAVVAYRFWYPTVSCEGIFHGNRERGLKDNEAMPILPAGPRHVGFTLNSDTPYGGGAIDLKVGPMVVELPPGPFIGLVDDHHQGFVADLGLPGPDAGKGGKHLILPPGYKETPPPGYFVGKSKSYKALIAVRSLPTKGDAEGALEALRGIKIYPLSTAAAPQRMKFVDMTEQKMDCTCLRWEDNLAFWEKLHEVLEQEPLVAEFRPMYGLLAALGIEKGKPFAPDERMRELLVRAAKEGRAQMFRCAFASDRPERLAWKDRRWEWAGLVPDVADFETPTGMDLDARDRWFVQAIVTSPAMFRRKEGAGSLYWLGCRDAGGAYLDGAKSYKLSVPAPVPAKLFWSVTLYDAATRSEVQAPQDRAALRSLFEKLEPGPDGAVELYFGPQAPAGKEDRWIQTVPGRAWFSYFRIYGPTAAAFDGTWKPGDFQVVE